MDKVDWSDWHWYETKLPQFLIDRCEAMIKEEFDKHPEWNED